MAKLTIDGQQIEVADGTRLYDACAQVRGEPLPHFCYHPDLPIAGVCRLCQVEIEGQPKLTIACNTIVSDGMVMHTNSERVRRAVRQILELHLINHPVDCPICDQAGECGLQDLYQKSGLYESRVTSDDKVKKGKAVVIGPQVILDRERCVLCSTCVRFCYEVTGTRELGIFNRGDLAEVGVAPGRELANNYSLNVVDTCPVGALTSRDFRFQKRVWLLRSTPSVCPGCATGCNIRIDHEGGRIFRLKPRRNDEVNGPWMCDLGRMLYKTVHDEKRLHRPLLRQDGELRPVAWQEAWQRLEELLQPGQVEVVMASAGQTLEELVLWRRLGRLLVEGDRLLGGLASEGVGKADDLLLAADQTPNRQALRWLDLPEVTPDDLAARLPAGPQVVLVYGGDPAAADTGLETALAGCERLVYLGTHLNATARAANLVIPLSTWAEKDGLFANRQGRLQSFRRAIPGPDEVREDWRLLVDLLARHDSSHRLDDLAAVRRLCAGDLNLAPDCDLMNLLPAGLVPEPGPAGPAAGGED